MKLQGIVVVLVAGCLTVCAGAPAFAGLPPRPPKPVSLTITKSGKHLVVVVKCKNLTNKNAHANTDNLALDVRTKSPKAEYGVQSNGPGMPVAVHPYGGNGSTSGPATLKISVRHGTETFTFGVKSIHNPKSVNIRALNQGGQHTPFYSVKL
jgi:hypothetical protein